MRLDRLDDILDVLAQGDANRHRNIPFAAGVTDAHRHVMDGNDQIVPAER
ncbi:MAG: hypothetical protein ACRDJW_02340 [Thermomicrobiales bacterium]